MPFCIILGLPLPSMHTCMQPSMCLEPADMYIRASCTHQLVWSAEPGAQFMSHELCTARLLYRKLIDLRADT